MDVVNISRSRRFLRERPMHVNLFDRPRLVVDLLCLETGQEESRRGFERSDSLLVLLEGEARLRAGPQIESLQEMDAVLVPPGQEYLVANTGAGQMTAVVILTPKPSRAGEIRVPGDNRPFKTVRPDQDERSNGHQERSQSRSPAREGAPVQGARAYRAGAPERRPYPRRDGAPGRPAYPRRDGAPARPAYPRRDEASSRPAYPRRDDRAGRTSPPSVPGRGLGGGSPYPRRDNSAPTDERGGPRRGPTGGRGQRRDEGEGPVWYPKPKPAWRPRGAPPAGARSTQGAGPRRPRSDDAPPEGGGSRRTGPSAGGSRGRTGGYGASAPRGRSTGNYGSSSRSGGYRPNGAGRGGSGGEKKTGDARKASRGQGPLSGRRGPGRSGPRT